MGKMKDYLLSAIADGILPWMDDDVDLSDLSDPHLCHNCDKEYDELTDLIHHIREEHGE